MKKNLIVSLSLAFIITMLLMIGNRQRKELAQNVPPEETPAPQTFVIVGNTRIMVEIADTEEKRQIGLSNHASLDKGTGMFFIFDAMPVNAAFWMKGMSINIDMIWIKNGEISQIYHDVKPEPGVPDNELTFYIPDDSIDYVLEVPAGYSIEQEFEVGTPVDLSGI